MAEDYIITYEACGKVLRISPNSAVKLLAGGLRGFDSTGFDVKITPYASLNGGYPSVRRFGERELSITAEIDSVAGEEEKRRIVSMLDPTSEGVLDVSLFGVHRRISVIPCGKPVFERPVSGGPIVMTLYFVSPAVFFSDSSKKRADFYCAVPLLSFPMNFTTESGITTGLYGKTDHEELNNSGDTDCGFVVTIVAHGGNVENPSISLGDKQVRCPVTLYDGDVLVIDTRRGMKNITLNGERCFKFTRDSVFFTLPRGESTVSIRADLGGEYIDASLEYTPMYYGV
ncbi:MAG: phage tail family protein [Clostridia bacterium]|nr:phage tail family protein [Clostridia bacterium]